VALLVGCANDNGPTSPSADGGSSVEIASWEALHSTNDSGLKAKAPKGDGSGTAGSMPEDLGDASVQTKHIAATGGSFQFGRIALEFPPGALAEDTDITIVQFKDTEGKVDFELYPHGLQFQVAVTLTVYMGGTGLDAGDDVRQLWWNEDTGDWVDIGGVWSYPTMITPLEHFSRYQAGRVGW